MPQDVARLLKATKVHQTGITGRGIRVVMIDTGFAHDSHLFFRYMVIRQRWFLQETPRMKRKTSLVMELGNRRIYSQLLLVSDFIGVKIAVNGIEELEKINPASILEGFQKAIQQAPHIISFSGGNDVRDEDSNEQRSTLPNSLKALEAEILYAVASGITVVASAGNGSFLFPAMMPDVISAGGVYVGHDGRKKASDLASAYKSKIYPGRHVPDVCGLVGLKKDRYIMLPIQPGCTLDQIVDRLKVYKSGTKFDDGWASFQRNFCGCTPNSGCVRPSQGKRPQNYALANQRGSPRHSQNSDGRPIQSG